MRSRPNPGSTAPTHVNALDMRRCCGCLCGNCLPSTSIACPMPSGTESCFRKLPRQSGPRRAERRIFHVRRSICEVSPLVQQNSVMHGLLYSRLQVDSQQNCPGWHGVSQGNGTVSCWTQGKSKGRAATGPAAPQLHEDLLSERVGPDTSPADRLDAEVMIFVTLCHIILQILDWHRLQGRAHGLTSLCSNAAVVQERHASGLALTSL